MFNFLLKSLAAAANWTASASVNSASFFAIYQPKEPKTLKR